MTSRREGGRNGPGRRPGEVLRVACGGASSRGGFFADGVNGDSNAV